jgi:hypothetical protein
MKWCSMAEFWRKKREGRYAVIVPVFVSVELKYRKIKVVHETSSGFVCCQFRKGSLLGSVRQAVSVFGA